MGKKEAGKDEMLHQMFDAFGIVGECYHNFEKKLKVMTQPPKFPDLYLTEDLWDVLKKTNKQPRKSNLGSYKT